MPNCNLSLFLMFLRSLYCSWKFDLTSTIITFQNDIVKWRLARQMSSTCRHSRTFKIRIAAVQWVEPFDLFSTTVRTAGSPILPVGLAGLPGLPSVNFTDVTLTAEWHFIFPCNKGTPYLHSVSLCFSFFYLCTTIHSQCDHGCPSLGTWLTISSSPEQYAVLSTTHRSAKMKMVRSTGGPLTECY